MFFNYTRTSTLANKVEQLWTPKENDTVHENTSSHSLLGCVIGPSTTTENKYKVVSRFMIF